MKSAPILTALLLLVPACQLFGGGETKKSVAPTALGQPDANANAVDIGKLLAGVTDGTTATAAKGPLDAAVQKLKDALAGAQGSGAAAGSSGGDMTKQAMTAVLTKFGIGAGTIGTIDSLLGNDAVKAVLGKSLEQLKGLIPAGLMGS